MAQRYKGAAQFRYRVLCSLLSGRSVVISDIRSLDENPGLKEHEASFLRLLDKITNGTVIQINETGTELRFKPGILVGGSGLRHECSVERAISYFLEPVIMLAPFTKKPIEITLTGVTNDSTDPSVDIIRTVTLPLLKHFGIEDQLMMKIKKRGAPPKGGGEVYFQCPTVRALKPINLTEEGKVRRIRGIAYSTRVSPQTANRIVESARSILNSFMPDVFIYTDHYKGNESGNSPGFGLSLVAETVNGLTLATDDAARVGHNDTPEDLGKKVARRLLEVVRLRGCVDLSNQSLIFMLMVLCPEDISRVRVGKLSETGIQTLRLLRDFFGTTFKIQTDSDTKTVVLSCMGVGYTNIAKQGL